ncbi:MAG TPA: hypothetical protein VJ867_07780 [Gemmatimonadaceae bacterium]|nr:hypothetical protein [Gemmatimonadaceae bacterium]
MATYADVVLQDGSAFRLYHATYASDSLVGFNGPSFTSERRAIPHDSVSVIRIREFDPARTVTVGLAIVGAAIVIPIVVFLMMLTGGP